jgi:hypothetical protein
MRCLVIEDEGDTARYISNGLREVGHTPDAGSRWRGWASPRHERVMGQYHPRPHAPGWRGWAIDHRHDPKPW